MHICAWQSADSRVTTDHCRVTLRWVFTKSFLIAWNVQKRCLTDSRRWRDLRPLSRDRSATFFKKNSNCLKRPKTLFDSRPTVAWPQPLSRDRSATFFKIFPNRLKRPKNVVWQSSNGWWTSDYCRVTVQRLFSKTFIIAWNVQKTLFDSRLTVAWPPTTVAWPFSDFFSKFSRIAWNVQKRCLTVSRRSRDLRPLSRDRSATFFKIFPNRLKRPKIVVWQSADGRVTSDHCRVTVQRLSSKNFLIAWNVQKTLFDSRPTVAWPPTTVAWPFSDFFQNFPKSLETSKKRCLTVGWRSRDLRPLSRDRSATFSKIFPNCLKRLKNVVWQSADGRVTSDHSRTASHTASQMYISFFFFFLPKAWPRISFYRNGPILEISTSYQS